MKTIKVCAERHVGYQWRLTKFHEMLHLVWYIERFGAPRGFGADMGEKCLQVLAKLPASSCQKIYETFDLQALCRLHEIHVINKAMEVFLEQGLVPDWMRPHIQPTSVFVDDDSLPKKTLTFSGADGQARSGGTSSFHVVLQTMHGNFS